MKKFILALGVVLVVGLFLIPMEDKAHMGPGMTGWGMMGWFGPITMVAFWAAVMMGIVLLIRWFVVPNRAVTGSVRRGQMLQRFSRNRASNLWLSIVLLVAMAVVVASLSCSVNAEKFDAEFTEESGAKFADESDKFDVPYEPTPMAVVNAMLTMGSVGPNDFLVDLGSGDGRIVITAAKKLGARGFGVDLNPKLVELSKQYAKKMGVVDRAAFYVQDLFKTDISKADVVTMYLLPEVNLKVRPKVLSELRPGTRVVSHDYHMGEWRPDRIMVIEIQKSGGDESLLYLWIVPAKVAGRWQWDVDMPGGEQSFDLELTQEFQDIGGVVWSGNGRWRLFNATLKGNRISFSLVSEADDRMVRQDYEGRINGEVIEGTVRLSGAVRESRLKWRASRAQTHAEIPRSRKPAPGTDVDESPQPESATRE